MFACGGPNTDFADDLFSFLSSLNFQFNDIKSHPVKTGLDFADGIVGKPLNLMCWIFCGDVLATKSASSDKNMRSMFEGASIGGIKNICEICVYLPEGPNMLTSLIILK
jgi:hypothetical protein